MKLLIVESPAKAKTISGYLKSTNTWRVMASGGHIKNLPAKEHGIEVDNGKFVGKWVIEDQEKKKVVGEIKNAAIEAEEVFIATDGDYEGERIASDLIEEIGLQKMKKPYYRIVFLEITKKHILDVLHNSQGVLNRHSVEAQMARRMLDREIGYPLSQIIRKDFERNNEEVLPNGIGRVISASLAIVVESEKKRRTFVSKPYKKIFGDYVINGIQVRLTNKLKYFEEANIELSDTLEVIRKSPHIVQTYEEKFHDKPPPKPLTTSTLQRGMFYLHGFEEPYTMKLAQMLYEGIDIYGERLGLITYMRTDSFRLADEAVEAAIRINHKMYGEDYTLHQKRTYENREGAHEAHEAIRPTQFDERFLPEAIEDVLKSRDKGEDLLKLYTFVYKRFLATQLKNATFDYSYMEVDAGGNILSARANMLLERGWYVIGTDIISDYNDEYGNDREVILPEASVADQLRPIDINTFETYTRTPDRYGRGRFITTLENKGIGRPSTMATIIPNLVEKKYITIENKMLVPTALGEKVHEWTAQHFAIITETESAKKLEEKLDEIERGESSYHELIGYFHNKVEELKLEIGLDPNAPSPQMIEYAQSIAKANGQTLDLSTLKDKKKLGYYIEHAPKGEEVGKCPVCKKGVVFVNEKAFECNQKTCKMKLWKNGMQSFFDKFEKEVDSRQFKSIVKEILENGKITMNGLTTKKGKTGAVIEIKKNTKGDGYWLSVKEFVNNVEQKEVRLGEIVSHEQDPQAIIRHVTELADRVSKAQQENRRLQDEVYKDPLTRAFNRRKFDEDKLMIMEADEEIYLAFVDGDKFKTINDTYGHNVGDEVLKYIVNAMSDTVRGKSCSVYRFGGEEFIVSFMGQSRKEVDVSLNEMRMRIEHGEAAGIKTTVSIGYTQKGKAESVEDAIKRADEAVYEAKEQGRNCVIFKDSTVVGSKIESEPFTW